MSLRLGLALALSLAVGCAGSFEEARLVGLHRPQAPSGSPKGAKAAPAGPDAPGAPGSRPAACLDWDRTRTRETALGLALGGLAAGDGSLLGIGPRAGLGIPPGVQLGLGIGAALAGAGSVYLLNDAAGLGELYVQEGCAR